MAALVAVMISIAVSTADGRTTRHPSHPEERYRCNADDLRGHDAHHSAQPGPGGAGGCGPCALLFSRKVAKVIRVEAEDISADHRRYRVTGQLFFVSKVYFLQGFDMHDHPAQITIDLSAVHIWDQTGVSALNQLTRKLERGGSKVTVEGLNTESLNLLERIGTQPEGAHG